MSEQLNEKKFPALSYALAMKVFCVACSWRFVSPNAKVIGKGANPNPSFLILGILAMGELTLHKRRLFQSLLRSASTPGFAIPPLPCTRVLRGGVGGALGMTPQMLVPVSCLGLQLRNN